MSVGYRPGARAVLVLVRLAFGLLVVWPGGARADCPPLDTENTWLGVAARWQQQGVTPAQADAFVRQGAVPRFPATLWPPSGPAPLRVGLIWQVGRPEGVRTIEIDADGDGTPDASDSRDENLGHLYERPGQYAATIRIREEDGRSALYQSPVTVLTPAAFDAELRGRWESLKTALQLGDLSAALECVHSGRRQRHASVLRTLLRTPGGKLPRLESPDFRLLEMRYRGVWPGPGDAPPADVRFQPDADGVWRLMSLFTPVGDEP